MRRHTLLFSAAFTLLLFNQCAKNPVTGNSQLVFMTKEQEVQMGKEADPQIVAQYGLYEDKNLQNFITQKGNEMVNVSHRKEISYEFKIVDSDVINAFAIPGGYVYFTRGIMAHFNNEAEFAGVLGHEIGHIAARHSVEQQRNMILGQIGLVAGIVLVPQLAQFADAASQGLGLMFLKFGRDAERQSDQLGVEYSSKIGYDAQQMANFFHTLERQSGASGQDPLPDFLSTHPNPADRYKTVSKLATEWKKKLNLTSPQVNRDSYLKRVDGIVYGEDPKQGFVENSVFYHPVLRFQLNMPQGWGYQNTPQALQMATKDGKAMIILMPGQGSSLQEAAKNALTNFKLQLIESKETTVNGLKALAVIAGQVQQGGEIRTLSYFIQYGTSIYQLIGVSSLADFNAYAPVFTSSLQSFRELTDASKINRQPERIRVKTVAQNSTLQQVLRMYNTPDKRLEELAIVNGMNLNDAVAAGTLIKVLEK